MMTLSEDAKDVALTVANKLSPGLLFVIAGMIVEYCIMYFVITDISKYRIDAVVKIVQACLPGIKS